MHGAIVIVAAAALLPAVASSARAEQLLAVCATVPELGAIVREVGGDQVAVEVFTKPTEDPHFTPARPSLIKSLNACELLVQVGMDLEIGWLPLLVKNARNAAVLPGGAGFLDASATITPIDVPTGAVDRSMGDVHPYGNPHYLLDPVNGMRVAAAVRDRLAALRPAGQTGFDERLAAFRRRVAVGLVGAGLTEKYDVEKLALLAEHGKLLEFLRSQGEEKDLGGWLGVLAHDFGAKVIDDHPMWPYFARRFGLVVAAHLEPKPGIPPTTKHLADVIALVRREGIRVVLASAYYDPRHARFVAGETGAKVLAMANQAGARPGTEDYVAFIDYDVRQVAEGLKP
ncbi:MAG: zinc ABC transporter substrate-binding protein [Deltaproteobacteria bacterium]|nr:zinc ABC transporter substrate-binding protein [Deltaproteobacteria bacterium]